MKAIVDRRCANRFIVLRFRVAAGVDAITPTGTLVPSAIFYPPFRGPLDWVGFLPARADQVSG
ncbi:MAG TPA: hypothetical protein VN702_02490 [Acetobacteraceae bacterium]|nr:hypothetical protein [Acetobacteraceae bacterium]